MRLLREYSAEAPAYIDKGMLNANGVNSVIVENAVSSVFPAPDAGIGTVKLYVAASDYEKAKALLKPE